MSRLWRRPWLVILVVLAVTAGLGRYARQGRIDNRLEENVLPGADLERYYAFMKDFGNDRIMLGAVPFTALDAATLLEFFDLEERLKATGSVASIVSPVTILRESFDVPTREALEALVKDPKKVATFEKRLRDFSVLHDNIVSFEKGTLGAVVSLDPSVGETDIVRVAELKRVMTAAFGGRMVATGVPDIVRVIHEYTAFSQRVFTPATLVVVSVVLWLLYRSGFGMLAPLAVVIVPLVWVLGIFNALGNTSNFITSTVPPLLLAVGLTSCVHVLTDYVQLTKDQETFDVEVLAKLMRHLTPPIVLCQVTTVFGFLSLVFNGLGALRSYGIYSALGVLFSLGTVLVLLPALLLLFRVTRQRVTPLQLAEFAFDPITAFVLKRRYWILAAAFALGAAGLSGVLRLGCETSLIRYIPRSNPIVAEIRAMEARTSGIVPAHLVLERAGASLDQTLLDPAVCRGVAALERELRTIKDLDSATSYVDLIQDYDRSFSGEADGIPPSADEVLEYLDFYRPGRESTTIEEPIKDEKGEVVSLRIIEKPPEGPVGHSVVDRFITRDYARAHVVLRVRDISSREMQAIFERVEEAARRLLPADVSVHLTGRAVLWAVTSELLVQNQLQNFGWSVLTIGLVIMLHFGSFFLGLLAMVPNVLPVFIIYGVMGYWGLEINTVTGMLACVALGMVVDDTIHYIHTFRTKVLSGLQPEEAVAAATREKGGSIVFMAVVLASGFGVLMLSDFVPTFQFGALISCTFLLAMVFDLFLTPSILLVTRPFEPPAPAALAVGVPEKVVAAPDDPDQL